MMHQGLWSQIEKIDGPQTALRAQCRFEPSDHAGKFIITFLNRSYIIDLDKKLIFPEDASPDESADFIEQLSILAYLIGAKDKPLQNKLVKAETLATGEFFFRGPHQMPTDQLADAFGENPEKLYQAAEAFNAIKRDYGDTSVELFILPRLPITIVIWGGDDEFEARAAILFDQSAGEQLALDALGAAVNFTVSLLVKVIDN